MLMRKTSLNKELCHEYTEQTINQDNENILSSLFGLSLSIYLELVFEKKNNSWMKLGKDILEVILFTKDLWETEQTSCFIEVTCPYNLHMERQWSFSNSKAINRGLKGMIFLRKRPVSTSDCLTQSCGNVPWVQRSEKRQAPKYSPFDDDLFPLHDLTDICLTPPYSFF